MQTEETKIQETTPPTPEQQMAELSKVAKMQQKVLSELVGAHLGNIMHTLAFAPKMSGAEKMNLITQTVQGLRGVLDLGIDVTGIQVPEKGATGKMVATAMGILAQAQDNRMLLLAHNMQAAEKANAVTDLPVGSNVELNKAAEVENEA